ncbi:hypothetical protein HDU93_008483, partial [Gonapodya sp. JEL0774]
MAEPLDIRDSSPTSSFGELEWTRTDYFAGADAMASVGVNDTAETLAKMDAAAGGGMSLWMFDGDPSGIGHALAIEFARRGHIVYASARDVARIADVDGSPAVKKIALDVTSHENVETAVEQIIKTDGRIDVL